MKDKSIYFLRDGDNGTGWYYKKYWIDYGVKDVGPFDYKSQALEAQLKELNRVKNNS